MVDRSNKVLPVVKVITTGVSVLTAVGTLGLACTVNIVTQRVKNEVDVTVREKIGDFKNDMDRKFDDMKQDISTLSKDIRHLTLVSSERLAVVESKLGVPRR